MTYRYLIPGPPISKKNSPRIVTNHKTGKPFILPSKNYTDFEAAAAYFLQPKPPNPIDYPVTVRCIFYMPTRRKVDKSNLEEAIHDILTKYDIIADDNRDIVASTDGSRVYYDKANPRVEIEISPLQEEYEVWAKSKKKICTANRERNG